MNAMTLRRLLLSSAISAPLLSACISPEPRTSEDAAPPGAGRVPAAREPVAAPSLQVFTSDAVGFDTHSYWLDTGSEVVVFDAQFTPAIAEKLVAEIRAKTKSPIAYLVVTHPNPDKFNGATVFQKAGAKVVASESTARAIAGVHAYKKGYFVGVAKMVTDATYPTEPAVDVTFRGDLDLEVRGAKVRLHELAHAGVSSAQTVAYLPDQRALVVGDLVHHRAHAWLEGGIVDGRPSPDLASWRAALEELRAFEGATVYGGRGVPAPVGEAVTGQIAYLDRMEQIVADYVKGLGAKKAELGGPRAAEHHKAIRGLAEKAFPDHAHPYLVEYGVYGLAGAIAAR